MLTVRSTIYRSVALVDEYQRPLKASEKSPKLRIAVAGATGFIGAPLVRSLAAAGHQVVVLGRDREALNRQFDDAQAATYSDAETALFECDALVNLAVRNNHLPGTPEQFRMANVELVKMLHDLAVRTGVRHFIQISSFRAGSPGQDPYGLSKREADDWLLNQDGPPLTILRFPVVQQAEIGGRLAVFNAVPSWLGIAKIIGALRPEVSLQTAVDNICTVIANCPPLCRPRLLFVADPKTDDRIYSFSKRVMDVGFAVVVLTAFWWLLAGLWLAVKLDSPGPGIFVQERVGRQRRLFRCYKFRTMRVGARQAGTHELAASEVTSLGRTLRRLKLDELPQVINLLKGEMSLVGPRPCLPMQHDLIETRRARDVFGVLPGVTGLSQIRDIDMSRPEALALSDEEYLYRRSILTDLAILLATLRGSGLSDRTTPTTNT